MFGGTVTPLKMVEGQPAHIQISQSDFPHEGARLFIQFFVVED
jgi:hypothetical protein